MKNIFILFLTFISVAVFSMTLINNAQKIDYIPTEVSSQIKPKIIQHKISLSNDQKQILKEAKSIAIADGIKRPELVQGVIMQETSAGLGDYIVGGRGNSIQHMYYGLGQIKISTAKEMISKFPALWAFDEEKSDENIKEKLMFNDTFNIKVAVKLLKYLGINNNTDFAITAYNKGLTGAQSIDHSQFHYTQSVKKHANSILVALN